MPQVVIRIPDVGRVRFPSTMAPAEIEAEANRLYESKRKELTDAQAAKFPSSQEQGRGGAGINEPWHRRFLGAAGETYTADTALVHSPVETAGRMISGAPEMLREAGDFLKPERQVMRMMRGEPLADPAGLRPVVEPLMRGEIPEAAGALTGKGAAALSMAGVGRAAFGAPTLSADKWLNERFTGARNFMSRRLIQSRMPVNKDSLDFGRDPVGAVARLGPAKDIDGMIRQIDDAMGSGKVGGGHAYPDSAEGKILEAVHRRMQIAAEERIDPRMDIASDLRKAAEPLIRKAELMDKPVAETMRTVLQNRIEEIVGRNGGTKLDPLALWEEKRLLGADTKFATGSPAEASVNLLNQKLYSAMDDVFDRMVPDAAPINDFWSGLLEGRKLLENQARLQGNAPLAHETLFGTLKSKLPETALKTGLNAIVRTESGIPQTGRSALEFSRQPAPPARQIERGAIPMEGAPDPSGQTVTTGRMPPGQQPPVKGPQRQLPAQTVNTLPLESGAVFELPKNLSQPFRNPFTGKMNRVQDLPKVPKDFVISGSPGDIARLRRIAEDMAIDVKTGQLFPIHKLMPTRVAAGKPTLEQGTQPWLTLRRGKSKDRPALGTDEYMRKWWEEQSKK